MITVNYIFKSTIIVYKVLRCGFPFLYTVSEVFTVFVSKSSFNPIVGKFNSVLKFHRYTSQSI